MQIQKVLHQIPLFSKVPIFLNLLLSAVQTIRSNEKMNLSELIKLWSTFTNTRSEFSVTVILVSRWEECMVIERMNNSVCTHINLPLSSAINYQAVVVDKVFITLDKPALCLCLSPYVNPLDGHGLYYLHLDLYPRFV